MTTNTSINSNVSYSGLVEKYIGTAYDTVRVVADNINPITFVAGNLEEIIKVGQIEGIENIEELAETAIAASIVAVASAEAAVTAEESMNVIHLGGFLVPPTVDNNGNPLVAGVTYTDLNIIPVSMKQWDGSAWLVSYAPYPFIKTISDSPPILPVPGTQWTDSTTMRDYTWYQDDDSSQWIRVQ